MDWMTIDLNNPLIVLRVYLAALWAITALYGIKVVWGWHRRTGLRPIGVYSVVAALTGAASYFIGATDVVQTPTGFLWVAVLLTFTPISLILWLNYAKTIERDKGGV